MSKSATISEDRQRVNFDSVQPPNQKFAVLSFITPETSNMKDSTLYAIKVLGCFPTQQDACDFIKEEHAREGRIFNLYISSVGTWSPLDPSDDQIMHVDYADKKLNEIMNAYHDNEKLVKEQERMIKDQKMNLSVAEEGLPDKANKVSRRVPDDVKAKIEEIKKLYGEHK